MVKNKKFILALLSVVFIFNFINVAKAEKNDRYFKIGLSSNKLELKEEIEYSFDKEKYKFKKDKTGFFAAMGMNMNDNFRLELELNYSEGFDEKVQDILGIYIIKYTGINFMVNGYLDLPLAKYYGNNSFLGRFTPYLMFGVGSSISHLKQREDFDFGYWEYFESKGFVLNVGMQVGIGLSFNVAKNWNIDFDYRYYGGGFEGNIMDWWSDCSEDDFTLTSGTLQLSIKKYF